MPLKLLLGSTIALGVAGTMAGCYSPAGGMVPYTGAAQTYYSTERMPKTVTLVDTRNGEVVFAMEIPVGKQLTIDFDSGSGDDPVHRPDLMRYQVFPVGTTIGRLRSSMSVPNAWSRRIDVDVTQETGYTTAPRAPQPRTDQDVPPWWKPEAGPPPKRENVYESPG
ncbi:MAG: hypothetical protein ACYSTY_01425 [Planctomycetota bacterium]